MEKIIQEFLKLHYEPEHEKGQTCWCIPKTTVKNGEIHIEHNEQRIVLSNFITSEFQAFKLRQHEALEKEKIIKEESEEGTYTPMYVAGKTKDSRVDTFNGALSTAQEVLQNTK